MFKSLSVGSLRRQERPFIIAARLTAAAAVATGLVLLSAPAAFAAGPTAVNDAYTVHGATPLSPASPGAMSNDIGADPVTQTIINTTNVSHGSLSSGAGPGTFTYTPNAGFSGTDSFQYCIVDKLATATCISNVATITLTVEPLTAVDDDYSTPINTAVVPASPGAMSNDINADPTTQIIISTSNVSHGTLTSGAGPGSFTYTPNSGYVGADSFKYCVVVPPANATCVSNPATVTIHVGPSLAVDDTYSATKDLPLVVGQATGLLANDVNHPPLDSFAVTFAPSHGTVSAVAAGGGFTYTPDPGYLGDDAFQYCIVAVPDTLPCKSSNSATVTVHVVAAAAVVTPVLAATGVEVGSMPAASLGLVALGVILLVLFSAFRRRQAR